MSRPNILYLHAHDVGRYIQPYGYGVPTPNLQRFAEESVVYRQAFCVNPTCSPSRAGLLTGQWAHQCGMLGLVNRGWSLEHTEHLLPKFLNENGYETVLAGIQHIVLDKNDAGYTRVYDMKWLERNPAKNALEFLNGPQQKPFFLDVGFFDPHRIKADFAPQPDDEAPTDPRWIRPPAPFPDTDANRKDMAKYIDAMRKMDADMGVVLDALRESGHAENTLVICTTDHGIPFPEMKCSLTDDGIGVMLMLRGPGGFSGGRVVDTMVSHLDVFPTICEVAGLEPPSWLQGTSLTPTLAENDVVLHEELFAEVNYHAAYEPKRAIRTSRWKYVRRYDLRERPVTSNCDLGFTKDFWVDQGWREQQWPQEELYDLVFDPHEQSNLAERPEHAEVLSDLRARLDRWMQETEDPLSSGDYVPPAEQGVINDPEDLHHSPEGHPATEWIRKRFG